jgi:Ca-activated chloride channel family protein
MSGVKVRLIVAGTAVLSVLVPYLQGQNDRSFTGKVVMENGSPPPKQVAVERVCGGRAPIRVSTTNNQGEFSWFETVAAWSAGECFLRASLAGYESDQLGMETLDKSNHLPDIVLRSENSVVPSGAGELRARAYKAMLAEKWSEAERQLRAILDQYPKSGPIWEELGFTLVNAKRPEDARPAFERAIELAPRYLKSYPPLIQLESDAGDWESAERAALAAVKADALESHPDFYLDLAEIRVHQHEDGAEAAARKAIALDKNNKWPHAEYVLGLILTEAEDYTSAIAHLRRYLLIDPRAPEAAAVRSRIKMLQAAAAAEAAEAAGILPADASLDRSPEGATEVAAPGGLQALAAMAHLKVTPAPADFFREYCRAIAAGTEPDALASDPGFVEGIETYLAAAVEMSRLAGNRAGRVTLSPEVSPGAKTPDILKLFGWKETPNGAGAVIELSESPADSLRQQIPAALGLDELEVAKSLASGSSFHFEVHSAQAPLLEARLWRALLGGLPPGGYAEMFVRNPRYAVAYSGLASMGPGAASALISAVGLRTLVTRYADLLRRYGEAFSVSDGRAAAPGGSPADAAWERLAGASPHDAKAFFRALLAKDQGKLADFYFVLSRADAARQRFFTHTPAAAEQFYKWYRDSDEWRSRLRPQYAPWRQTLFQELPLDSDGSVRYPGGRAVWTSASGADENLLTGLAALEALVPVARVERERKAPLDEASARLLAEHYPAWRSLFPYFEKLPGLGRTEFEAVAAFEKSVSARPREIRNTVLGEWHSLVKLIELGTAAGSLSAADGARDFRRACEALSAPDYSAQSLAALRDIAGEADNLEEGVSTSLLRLQGERRASFDRLKEIERTPPLAAASDDRTLAALTGQVYAALLDPDILLVSEDPLLTAKHAFLGDVAGAGVFTASSFQTFHQAGSSHFSGGFADFEDLAAKLARSTFPQSAPAAAALPDSTAPLAGPVEPSPGPTEAFFRVSARMVEIYATITDDRGRYVDELSRADFKLLDNGQPAEIGAFENHATGVSVALLLDTTGSMTKALPALKSSALRLIDDLRSVDTVAVYSFNESVSELQPITQKKDLAKHAVLRTRASGKTGLHDALVHVTRELSGRPGKKVVVVFTDGDDNVSTLTPDAVIRRAKTENVAVYTIAHGDALGNPELMAQLESVAKATGGLSFAINDPSGIRAVFDHITQDLLHGYLLAFQPAAADENHEWRSLQIVLRDGIPRKVRAREGYFSIE